ncbi:pilus assembly protein TadG-related protein [Plantactinospora sp. CA-290183]|uniref:pilus assembly protein TadG-related protein n=1 Tax=Plantactinospora sp. CA-290183 TaxID=3240006 RepID=UPI003D8A7ED1
MTGRPDRDAGRVSLFLAVAMIGILTIIALAYDGAGQLRSMQRADNLAAEAARAGGQAIDLGQLLDDGTTVLDPVAAEDAVRDYLAGVDGVTFRDLQFDTEDDNPTLTVRLDLNYDRAFLDLFGFADTVDVPGTATATLLTSTNR